MKKHLLFLIIIFSFFFNNTIAQTVYVTKSGKKYHTFDCRYIKKSSISIDLTEAQSRGYDACSVCSPSTSTTSESPSSSFDDNQGYNGSSKDSNEKVQCSAITKKGTRCKRTTKSPNGKCWQHGGD